MFNAVLREQGKNRLVYSPSAVPRVLSACAAVVIGVSVVISAEGPLLARFNALSLILIGVCLFTALYMERWRFDREANVFERNVGLSFLYSKKKRPLDSLTRVVLHEPLGTRKRETPALMKWADRGTAVLSLVDREAHVYTLEVARGSAVRELRLFAEKLSAFCDIPLEDDGAPAEASP